MVIACAVGVVLGVVGQAGGVPAGGEAVDARARALVGQMTTEEKISQLMHASPAIPRLKLPAYDWWNECLHGVARAGRATVFPQAIGLGATFDPDLMRRVGAAIADEARAKHNVAVQATGGDSPSYQGLTFWTPNINIYRDPRWGRGQETYGEDPFLTGAMGAAFVRGLQGDDPNQWKVAACAKHFAVHSGPESSRHSFNAVISAKDLNETYLPAFERVVRAGVAGVMCAYNRVDDEPCCGSNLLLKDYLRGRWGFDGYVVSDCGAISDMHNGHHVTKDAAESAAMGVKLGVNIECGRDYVQLGEAMKRGLLTNGDLDAALVPAMRVRAKLGLLDDPKSGPFAGIGLEVINCEKHRLLAREAAVKSLVLLKNKDGVLPLKKEIGSICVTGPNATSIEAMIGNYAGVSGNFVSVLEGVTQAVSARARVLYSQGCLVDRGVNGDGGAGWMASECDAVIAVMGLDSLMEGEEGDALLSTSGGDRKTIELPKHQVEFVRKLRKNAGKRPLVVVMMGGGPIACPEVQEIADAVLFAWYPGEQGGAAVADVVFGDASPSGRLPVTFPKSTAQLPPFDNYAMAGRTYRYMTEEPLYPFGFGLSYGKFEYGELTIEPAAGNGEVATARVDLKNAGSRDAEEVVQLYVTGPAGVEDSPRASLKGVKRVSVKAGGMARVEFAITSEMLQLVNEKGESRVVKGEFTISIGGVSPGARGISLGAGAVKRATLAVE